MKEKKYWGRYVSGKKKEELWHAITALSELEATAKMLKGTKYFFHEVEITTKEPAKYAGKYKNH